MKKPSMLILNSQRAKGLALIAVILTMATAFGQDAAQKNEIKSLGFKYEDGKSKLEVELSGEAVFEKSVSEADKQVIINVKNATIGKKWARRIDASQHQSNIAMISPYQAGDDVRIVLQLKENGDVDVSQNSGKLVALIDNKKGSGAPAEGPVEPVAATPNPAEEPTSNEVIPASAPSATTEIAQESASSAPASSSSKDPSAVESMDGFFDAQKSKNYVGKKINLQFRDAELTDVLNLISQASEFNIVVSDNVKGKVMLNLSDVPWDQALDLILTSYKLAGERRGNILRITTLDSLTKEKEAEASAKKATEAAEPLVVKIFPISYAKPDDLKKILTDFLSKEGSSTTSPGLAGSASSANLRGGIQVDNRTNSLIVRDTPSAIEKIKRIIQELDTQTPQILIEGKFVEVSENKTNSISGRLFLGNREVTSSGAAFVNTKNSIGGIFGGSEGGDFVNPFAVTPLAGGGMSLGFSPKTKLIPGLTEVGALLQVLEFESSAKVIASPRIVTQNKEMASISQGSTIYIQTAAGVGGTGSLQQITVNLALSVTPQITNDGSILLQINFNQDSLSASPPASASLGVDTKNISTKILVDSGATLVIGGVYRTDTTEAEGGIPFLRNLPLVGALFGAKQKSLSKRELFIFLTPRILNIKESGLSS